MLPLVHDPTGLPLDVVIAGPGLEDRFLERAIVRDIERVRVPVASPEDMVIMKILAGRPRDDQDVVAMLAASGDRLDLTYVREALAVLETALGQSDLLRALAHAVSRVER